MKVKLASYISTDVNDELFLEDGCLYLDSEIFGDWNSELHYSLDKEAAQKLIDAIGGVDRLTQNFTGNAMCWKFENLCKRYGVEYKLVGF